MIHIEFPKGKAVCNADMPDFGDETTEPDCPKCIADHDRVTSEWLFSKEGERSMAALEQELIAEGNSPYPPIDPFGLEAHKIKSKVWAEEKEPITCPHCFAATSPDEEHCGWCGEWIPR